MVAARLIKNHWLEMEIQLLRSGATVFLCAKELFSVQLPPHMKEMPFAVKQLGFYAEEMVFYVAQSAILNIILLLGLRRPVALIL